MKLQVALDVKKAGDQEEFLGKIGRGMMEVGYALILIYRLLFPNLKYIPQNNIRFLKFHDIILHRNFQIESDRLKMDLLDHAKKRADVLIESFNMLR